ncbi:MAG: hypothetical protein EPN47_17960 [Acidobacteria bacterium]|nr:MAG: hypothetical protein EPN47_17960 [Acidobacteriota bacterium]
MHAEQISDLFRVQERFLRSAHLERDFADAKALKGYILTPQTTMYLKQLAGGLDDNSGQRAWRITGDYGSGKSSFALLLAHLFGTQRGHLPGHLRQALDFKSLGIQKPQLVPVLTTGAQEPIAVALLRSLHRTLLDTCGRGRPPAIMGQIQTQLASVPRTPIPDATVVRLLTEAATHVVAAQKGSGLLIILDELGKFLEYGALHPEVQDVLLLQSIAEAAARSGRNPLFVVGLLHQGFNAYAEHLSQSAQKEWEKVAGRFDELVFNQPLEQTAKLIADALNIRTEELHRCVTAEMRRDMAALLDLGWYGAAFTRKSLLDIAPRLYPLHPSVIPVLIKLFSRFGQNERSLFSFLLSNEPFGLKDFARQPIANREFYRIHNLYDYARYSFGYRLGRESFRSHWNHIDSMVESFPAENITELQIMKTVGLLNLVDSAYLLPSEQALVLSIAAEEPEMKGCLRRLKSKCVMYHRGVAGGYCLWPHTSVNLEKAYGEATRRLGQAPRRVAPYIDTYLETRPIVARRHYIKTGNLRHFEVCFSPVDQLSRHLGFDSERTDGRIIVALCETEEERVSALQFAESDAVHGRSEILIAIPRPLRVLGRLVQEVQWWEWVIANTPELANDSFATEEVSRQVAAARDALHQRLKSFISVQHSGSGDLCWFRQGNRLAIARGSELVAYLSTVCEEIYRQAPKIENELVNRRVLSSAAAAARMRLLEGIFAASSKPYLGMEQTKKPPEMSIYLSILKRAKLHREGGHSWVLVVPKASADPCSVRPALERIQELFDSNGSRRIKVSAIFGELRKAPFGIRDGLAPILLAVYAVINEQHIAFYDNGAFMREMVGLDVMRLVKRPEIFEIQYCKMAGLRTELFERLLKVLGIERVSDGRRSEQKSVDILDVVKPLSVFAAKLQPFTQKTKRLPAHAVAVRTALLTAREPATLLFHDLPVACGFSHFTEKSAQSKKEIDLFVAELKSCLTELRMAYPALLDRIKTEIVEACGIQGTPMEFRATLARRARQLLLTVTEPRMKAFCNRLLDTEMAEPEWIESVGSLLCSIPPSRWSDADVDRFSQELAHICTRFQRIEALAFDTHREGDAESATRFTITQLDGSETNRVIYVTKEEEARVKEVEKRVSEILAEASSVGLAGAVRALWEALCAHSEGVTQ